MREIPDCVALLHAEQTLELVALRDKVRELEQALEYNNRIRREAEDMAEGYAGRVKELEQELQRYGEHLLTCTYEYEQCDCGLDEALAALHAPR